VGTVVRVRGAEQCDDDGSEVHGCYVGAMELEKTGWYFVEGE
jgi:hypothetical protein